MYTWIDGFLYMDSLTDGWIDGSMDGWMHGGMEGWMPTEIDRVRFRVCVRPQLCIYIYTVIYTLYMYILDVCKHT